MVKSYLRYEPAASFGVIVSVESNITYDSTGKHLLAPALEKLDVWHVRQGVCTKTLSPSVSSHGPSLAVTCVASAPSSLVKDLAFSSIINYYNECSVSFYSFRRSKTLIFHLYVKLDFFNE